MAVRVTRLFLGVILATVPFWTQRAQAQVTLSAPVPESVVPANACPVAPCTAPVAFEVDLKGSAAASVVLAFTPESGLGFVQSLCSLPDDIEGIPGCPNPPVIIKRTLNIPVGSWNVVVRVLRNNRRETTSPTHFTVSAPNTAPVGPVSLLRVEPNEGYPPIPLRKPSTAWPTGIVSEAKQVDIIGRNLNNNSFLKVYLAPRPNGEADLIASSALPIPTWCLFEAEILSRYGLKDGNSVLKVKIPELPLTVPSECLPSPVSVGSIYDKRWRWVIEDRLNRPEQVHTWWAIPSPRLTDPAYGVPSFKVTRPPYPLINGFGFENEGTPATYTEFLTVYGNSAYLCLDCIPGIGCTCKVKIPDPLYILWWVIYQKAVDSANGSCNGMAATSLLMAKGDLKPESFNADVLSPYGFTADDQFTYYATYKDTNWCTPVCSPPKPDNLWANIRMNHGVQISREFLKEILDTVGDAVFDPNDWSTFKGVPNATLERVKTNPQGYVICITNRDGGHCVTPYEVFDKSIHVYDNNNPGDLKRYINIVRGDYDYPARRKDGKDPNRGNGIFAYPISIWKNPRHMLGLNDGLDFLSLITVGNADMTVTNKKGGRWGWEDNGRFSDSYFGALAIPMVGMQTEKSRTMPLMIAMNQPAPTIRINARGGQYYLHAGEGGHLFQIEAGHAKAGDKDQVRLHYAKEDLASFDFTPQRDAGNFVPRVGLEISEEESGVFHWIGLKVPRGKTIQIGADRKTKSVNYRNDTGAATQHLLILDAGARAHTRMIYGPFEVPSGATQRIVLKHWPDTSTVVSELDLNGDGTTDQTAVITGNRANPPTPAGGFADLTIERTIAPEHFNVGQEASYSLQVVNKGSHNATSVLLTSSFSSTVELSAVSSTKGRCTASRGRITCEIGSLAIGQSATISYRVKANRRGLLTNVATAFSELWDSDSTNNNILTKSVVR